VIFNRFKFSRDIGIDLGTANTLIHVSGKGVVLQDTFIFSGNVADNLKLSSNIDNLELENLSKELGLNSLLKKLPEGLNTFLRERGGNLSSGERQLLSVARVAIRNPVVLIMDEATAFMDPSTEATLQKDLERILSKRTALVIAHRLATIESSDKIYVIDNGSVVAEGKHNELLESSDIYKNFYNKQIKNKTWRLGFTICEDLWVNKDIEGRGIHKKNPLIDIKKKKVDILVNLSASPYTFKKLELRCKVSSFAAKYLQVPLIYVNQIGANDNLIFDGNSFILNKNGSKIKQLKSFSEDLSSWDIELTKPQKNKFAKSEMSSIFDALVLGVRDYAQKCGFKTALIGLSGGIDSALVSAIATAALVSNNI